MIIKNSRLLFLIECRHHSPPDQTRQTAQPVLAPYAMQPVCHSSTVIHSIEFSRRWRKHMHLQF